LQTDLHEKCENLNKNLNLPALSQLQSRPSLTSAFISLGRRDGLVGKLVALTLATALRRTFAAITKAEPMGLSDWVGIFAIITFVGFASVFYEVATRVLDD
jgi:hypothetical protein